MAKVAPPKKYHVPRWITGNWSHSFGYSAMKGEVDPHSYKFVRGTGVRMIMKLCGLIGCYCLMFCYVHGLHLRSELSALGETLYIPFHS